MDSVKVPFADPDESTETVLLKMVQAQRSGVVTGTASEYRLIGLDALLLALRDNPNGRIGQVSAIATLARLNDIGTKGEIMSDQALWRQAEDRLDSDSAMFALLGIDYDTATILTRHEGYSDAFLRRSTDVWKCQGNGHYLRTDQLDPPGDVCRYDGSTVVKV